MDCFFCINAEPSICKKKQPIYLYMWLLFSLQIFGERHIEKIRSIFEMSSALLHDEYS